MPKVLKGYSTVQIYKYYKGVMQEKKGVALTQKQFRNIVYLFNKKLSQLLLDGGVVKLPFGLAEMRIKKTFFDHVIPSFDYGTYNKTGKKLVHLNEHSDGFRAKWYWNKGDVWLIGNNVFSFVPSWTNKRALAQVMKSNGGHKKFME